MRNALMKDECKATLSSKFDSVLSITNPRNVTPLIPK